MWQMRPGQISGRAPFNPAVAAGITWEDAGWQNDDTNGVTSTFNAKPIGTAAASRLLIIMISANRIAGGVDINSLTVNGNAATLVKKEVVDAVTNVAIFQYALATGATANIVVDYNGTTVASAGCGVIALYGANATATASDSTSGFTTTLSRTLTVPAGGVAFGVGTAFAALTWSGTDTAADSASTLEGTFFAGMAHNNVAGSKTLTITWSGSNHGALAVAAWGP